MGPRRCQQPSATTSPHTPPPSPSPIPPPSPPPSPSLCTFFRSGAGRTSQEVWDSTRDPWKSLPGSWRSLTSSWKSLQGPWKSLLGTWKSLHGPWKSLRGPWVTLRAPTVFIVLLVLGVLRGAQGCTKGNKEVGVCLHRYLERDFLSLERIVYPKKQDWLERNRYAKLQLLPPLPPLPPLPEYDEDYTDSDSDQSHRSSSSSTIQKRSPPTPTAKNETTMKEGATEEASGGGRHHLRHYRGPRRKRKVGKGDHDRLQVGNLQAGNFGQNSWVEGPELEDYCKRLEEVVLCFKDILEECDNSYDFFRYRHLLHSLSKVHVHLCDTPEHRRTRFLAFLGLIECAEKARISSKTCHRHNITNNVWNQILRLEVGPELCDALNVQRACLLEEDYIGGSCKKDGQEQLYKEVSAIFLATWCKIPGHPHLPHYFGSASRPTLSSSVISVATVLFTLMWRRPYLSDFT